VLAEEAAGGQEIQRQETFAEASPADTAMNPASHPYAAETDIHSIRCRLVLCLRNDGHEASLNPGQ